MRIGLVVPSNIKYAPYVQYYTDVLTRENVDFQVMSWDKTGTKEPVDMAFTYKTSDFDRKRILIGHYLFAQKCRAYIKKEKIDSLIVFTIAPLFFLGYRFLAKFQQKLIIDIRDDSPFRTRFPQKLASTGELAAMVTVSSPYYAEWVKRETYLCHNADQSMIERYAAPYGKEKISIPASIVFAGIMNEEQANIDVNKALADTDSFNLALIGRDNEKKDIIKRYVQDHNIQNVSFEGEYRKDDIVDIYRNKADLINIFRANTIVNRNALPNKLYDAVLSGVPVAVYDHNIAIANYVKQYHLGIVLNEKGDLKEQLLRYAQAYDASAYRTGRDEFIRQVRKDYKRFEDKLTEFCRGK